MSDIVRDYLRSRRYTDHVIRGGLEGLVRMWEHVVASVASGESQDRDDYLNDMDGRRILEEALAVAPAEERSKWAARVQAADDRIRLYLIPTEECLWGDDNARKEGYSRKRDRWYYHSPKGGLC